MFTILKELVWCKNWPSILKRMAFILLMQVPVLLPIFANSPSEIGSVTLVDRTLSGTVKDTNGDPIIGATIRAEGTDIGTVSDIDGTFSLTIPDESQQLNISYIGYLTAEIEIGNQSVFNIILEENAVELSEVVVVGYGKQENNRVSAAVQQVKSEDLEISKRPVSTIESGLVGSVPGLILNQNSGQLGAEVGIQIRSVGTLNNNNALILVDGIESSIQNINPNDIQSVTILKDASATAIYGARGANGVVLITTKETQKEEQTTATFSGNISWQSPNNTAELLNAQQFMESFNAAVFNEAFRRNPDNPNFSAPYSDVDLARAASGFYPETNWVDELYNETAVQHNYNLGVQGGSKNVGYLLSLGYLNQDGISQGPDNLERISLRLKVDADINDWLTFGVNAYNANRTLENLPVATNSGLRGQPFYPVQLTDGEFAGTYVFKGSTSNEENPIAKVRSGSFDRRISDELNLQLYGIIKPLKNLSIEGRVSYVKTNDQQQIWDNPYEYIILNENDLTPVGNPVPFSSADRSLSEIRGNTRSINSWVLVQYEKSFNEVHNLNFLAGSQSQSGEGDRIIATRQGFILPNLQNLTLGFQPDPNLPFGNNGDFTANPSTFSYFGRVGYDYNRKYLLEFSFRADASSNFIREKWGYFPAVSAGWNIHEENFLGGLKNLDILKVRASWGINGDDNILNASNREVVNFNPSGVGFGGNTQPTVQLDNSINPNLTWETSEKINVGIDLTLWKGKLSFTGDYFVDYRKDLIALVQTSVSSGLTTINEDGQIRGGILDNVYDARSWGTELVVSHRSSVGQVGINASANFSFYDSELTEGPTILNSQRIQRVGLPISGSFFGYETAGYFNTEADIDNWVNASGVPINQSIVVTQGTEGKYLGGYRFVDQLTVDTDGDGVADAADGLINDDDRIILLNNPIDNYRIGATLGLSYKGFSLSGRIYGVLQGSEWLNNGSNINAFTSSGVAPFRYQIDTWTPDNSNAIFSQSFANSRPYTTDVSGLIIDRDFIKIKNVNLAYRFAPDLLKKQNIIKALDIYVSFENLGVLWTNYKLHEYGFDPEFGANGFRYPQSIKTSVGANIQF